NAPRRFGKHSFPQAQAFGACKSLLCPSGSPCHQRGCEIRPVRDAQARNEGPNGLRGGGLPTRRTCQKAGWSVYEGKRAIARQSSTLEWEECSAAPGGIGQCAGEHAKRTWSAP